MTSAPDAPTSEPADPRPRAEANFAAALERSGARDPRDFYRERLRQLKAERPDAFRRAVAYHDERLIPAVADSASDPLAEWLEYGRLLAELLAEGETVQVDTSGLAAPYAQPVAGDRLVLHLPRDARRPALLVGLPPELSPAQRATHELLVNRAQR